jgi:hypothetical protein
VCSRCLHDIEFLSDLVSNTIAIGQVKEIARHAKPTPPRPIAFLCRQADDLSAIMSLSAPTSRHHSAGRDLPQRTGHGAS